MEVLLVEDSPGDVRLTQEAFRAINNIVNLHIATDGVEAADFLMHRGDNDRSPHPDFMLLDLNLPKMDGREVLAYIKEHESLKSIPTVIMTNVRCRSGQFEKLSAKRTVTSPSRFSWKLLRLS
jgi:two-component system, chemotaxis family, response regulator Rcp1